MKDSILKGTGNSRFLKSAIPEGTTWAEALAMLRAGTFPMDLNGLNSAGFQQVGTPLNKANLLKDVSALTLGLTGDAVPDDMFNILAHAGDLHVWRKTTVTPAGTTTTYPVSTNRNAYQEGSDAKPAGYTLGDVVKGSFRVSYASNSVGALYGYCDSITVDDDGTIHPKDASSFYVDAGSSSGLSKANSLKGKFIYLVNAYGISGIPFEQGVLYYVPNDAVFTQNSSYSEILVNRYQPVTSYAAIPANTTIEYLGCLGDKSSVELAYYIGTGVVPTADNPLSITFSHPPKIVIYIGQGRLYEGYYVDNFSYFSAISNAFTTERRYVAMTDLTTEYRNGVGFGYYGRSGPSAKKSADGKTIYWYPLNGNDNSGFASGIRYYFLAIG